MKNYPSTKRFKNQNHFYCNFSPITPSLCLQSLNKYKSKQFTHRESTVKAEAEAEAETETPIFMFSLFRHVLRLSFIQVLYCAKPIWPIFSSLHFKGFKFQGFRSQFSSQKQSKGDKYSGGSNFVNAFWVWELRKRGKVSAGFEIYYYLFLV